MGVCVVLKFISVHVCFMERNGHSRLIEPLKAKFNICVLILSVYVLYVFYICLTYNVCVFYLTDILLVDS